MSQPLVSVLMPAYNHEAYVRGAVESVLGQTHANLELIAIDDASPDGTWAVLESIKDQRLWRHRHETNQGAHATLNDSLWLARGEFIAILHSVDVFSNHDGTSLRIDRRLTLQTRWLRTFRVNK